MSLFTKTDREMERYIQIRELATPLITKIGMTVPRELILQSARDLGMLGDDGSTLAFQRKTDIDYVMDRAIFDMPSPKERWIEIHCQEKLKDYSREEQAILSSYRSAYFSLYEVLRRDSGRGIWLQDLLQPREIFLMDKGMGGTASPGWLLATRVVTYEGLNFSSGASAIFSPEQKDVWLTRMQWLFGQSQKGWSWETFMRHAAPVFIKAFQDEDIDYRTTPVTGDLEEESDPVDEDSADLEFAPPRESPSKLGRNDPCHCGSGKKYKKCCLSKDEEGRPKERLFERAAKHHLIYSADQFPVERCLINENWKKSRLAQIVVTREFEPGLLLYGVYLADLGCMGIKSSFCNVGFTIEEFETTLMVKLFGGQAMIPIGVQYAKEIIVGALNYADALGI